MKTLRPYQQEFYREIQYAAAKHKRILAQATTGSGKTVVLAEIAKAAINKNKTVLVLTESRRIFPQLSDEVGNCLEISAGVKNVPLETSKIIVSMSQTLARRPVFLSWFKGLGSNLIIIADEAHLGVMTNVLEGLPEAYLIGFTATPDFKTGRHLPVLYREIVCSLQPSELVELGFLSPYTHLARTKADLSSLQKKGGEYTEESQFESFEKAVVYEGLIQDLATIPFKKCLVFCSSIKHAESASKNLLEAGYANTVVHSESDPANLETFTHGDVNICVSVGMLTKGWDYKPTDLVVLLRATTSLPLMLQMIGRASRTSEGKTGFVTLDYGDNWRRLGLWIHDRDWRSLWKGKPKNGEGVAPIRDCPSCGFIMAANIMQCPNCQHIFEARKEDLSINKTNLIDLTAEFNLLRGRKISTLTPAELVAYVKTTNKKTFGLRIVKAKLQKEESDFVREYARLMQFKPGFLDYVSAEVLYSDETIEFHDITIR